MTYLNVKINCFDIFCRKEQRHITIEIALDTTNLFTSNWITSCVWYQKKKKKKRCWKNDAQTMEQIYTGFNLGLSAFVSKCTIKETCRSYCDGKKSKSKWQETLPQSCHSLPDVFLNSISIISLGRRKVDHSCLDQIECRSPKIMESYGLGWKGP